MKTVTGYFRLQMLLLVLYFGVAVAALLQLNALSPFSLVGVLAVAVLLVLLMSALVGRQICRPLSEMREGIEQMYKDGDLTRRISVTGHGEIAETAESFNRLIASFQTIIGKVFFNSQEVASASRQLIVDANQVADGSAGQYQAAESSSDAMMQLTGNMQEVSQRAHQTAEIAQSASELSQEGMQIARLAAAEMDKIAQSVTESARVVQVLGERSRAISGIVQTIHEIADQTNLLALNAAIEAARAGEQGRGFAVVADEVRKLAERTSVATGEITGMIGAIQGETDSAIAAIQAGNGQAREGAAYAKQAADALERILSGASETMRNVDAIAAAIEQQNVSGHEIADHVRDIMEKARSNSEVSVGTLKGARHLDYLSFNLREIGDVFKLGPGGDRALQQHARMPEMIAQAASRVSQLLEKAVENGQVSMDALFGQSYTPIPNTKPQKFNTPYDALCDRLLPDLQEALVSADNNLVYAIACDIKGYVPTHNKRFSQPLTGDEKIDFVNNRTKRVFDDPVGRRCGQHEQPFLLQTYRRDTGEIMHDISAPIYVRGKHWGGFRIGYRTEV